MRNAYRMFRSLRAARNERESSTSSKTEKFWKGIWRLKIPHKVKLFAWRTCIEGLPTKSNMKRRKVVKEETCHICSLGIESTIHAFY